MAEPPVPGPAADEPRPRTAPTDAGCQPTAVLETALGSDVYETVADYVALRVRRARDAVRLGLAQAPAAVVREAGGGDRHALDRPTARGSSRRRAASCSGGTPTAACSSARSSRAPGGDRVARVLTAGTPYWGSPKSFFPLAFGVESPGCSTLDLIINNDRLKSFAKNLSGLYNLYPSANFPPWLTRRRRAAEPGRRQRVRRRDRRQQRAVQPGERRPPERVRRLLRQRRADRRARGRRHGAEHDPQRQRRSTTTTARSRT